MRGFVAVFEREIVERRLLPLAALALGLVPLAAPLLPGLPSGSPAEVRSGVALGLALIISLVLALSLGGSVIARDLGERRLGFYFARPISGGAIWAGKLAAAAALAAGAGALVLLPVLLIGDVPDPSGYWSSFLTGGAVLGLPGLAIAWLGVILLVVVVANAAGVILRTRSPWLLLDLVALSVTVAIVWTCLEILTRAGAGLTTWRGVAVSSAILRYVGLVVYALVLLALAAASAAQVRRGRTDLRRGHRVLSIVLWSALLPASLALAGYTRWFKSPSPQDLVSIEDVVPAPAGSWIALYGLAAHRGGYLPGFLVDAGSGRFIRTGFGLATWIHGQPLLAYFSADGARAVWLEPSGDRTRPEDLDLMTLDLRRPGASPRPVQVSLKRSLVCFGLSRDGRYAAAVQGGRLVVMAVASGRLLASVSLGDEYHQQESLVVSSSSVLLYGLDSIWTPQMTRGHQVTLSISELNLATGKLTKAEVREIAMGNVTWTASPSGDRGLLRASKTLQLRDGATGKLVADLGGEGSRASFLPDGRIALLDRGRDGSDLRLLDAATGAELRRFHFPGVRTVLVADQPSPNRVRAVTRGPKGTEPWQLWTLDLATGEARLGPRLALTELPFRRTGPWRSLRGDGVVWFDLWNARTVVVLRDGLPSA
ncbi:MAG TPA: hypothetical protein VGS07_08025 [Thermoanaerobaculia bacterium]|jgi:hypothetical protein|nr:hypothetical protein [Thermoanaerobaculia bacterium]